MLVRNDNDHTLRNTRADLPVLKDGEQDSNLRLLMKHRM